MAFCAEQFTAPSQTISNNVTSVDRPAPLPILVALYVFAALYDNDVAERKSKTLYIRQIDRLRALCYKMPTHVRPEGD